MIRPQPATTSGSARPARPPTHQLQVFTESTYVKDVAKGILHTIFFHRIFPAVRPLTRDIVFTPPSFGATRIQPHPQQQSPYAPEAPAITFPLVDDADVESAIAKAATQLAQILEKQVRKTPSLESSQVVRVHFFEKKRKKAATGFAGFWKEQGSSGDVNGVCWESWELTLTTQSARAAQGRRYRDDESDDDSDDEYNAEALIRKSVKSCRRAMMDTIRVAGTEKDHIPPITSADSNPFPYEVVVDTPK